MALGMTLLSLQILLQIVHGLSPAGPRHERRCRSACSTAAPRSLVMFSGMPIAFALGAVAIAVHGLLHAGGVARYGDAERLRGDGLDHAAVDPAVHPEGRGDRPLARRPGPLLGACTPGCTASPAGSASPTCSPARSLPRWRARARRPARRSARPASRRCASAAIRRGFAAGIIAAGGTLGILLPPSITMILYAVAAEQSLGRLFLAGIGPGAAAGRRCSPPTRCCRFRQRIRRRQGRARRRRRDLADARRTTAHRCARSSTLLPRVLPFVILLTGVMVALYGGYATPSETAGLGAVLALVLIAVDLRRLAPARPRADPVVDAARIDHADDDHRHVAALFLRDELPAHLAVGGAGDRRAAALEMGAAGGDPAASSSCSASSCRRSRSS